MPLSIANGVSLYGMLNFVQAPKILIFVHGITARTRSIIAKHNEVLNKD